MTEPAACRSRRCTHGASSSFARACLGSGASCREDPDLNLFWTDLASEFSESAFCRFLSLLEKESRKRISVDWTAGGGNSAEAEASKSDGPSLSYASFPCRLPFIYGRPNRSRRELQRSKLLRECQRWTNVQFGLYSYFELGAPRGGDSISRAAQSAAARPWTKCHEDWAQNCLEDALAFRRAARTPNVSRGVDNLLPLLERLELSSYGVGGGDLESLVEGARTVRPGHVSLPAQGGQCKPERLLKGVSLNNSII